MTNDAKNKLAARKAKCFAILIAGGKRKMADAPQTIRQEVESKCAEYIVKKIPIREKVNEKLER